MSLFMEHFTSTNTYFCGVCRIRLLFVKFSKDSSFIRLSLGGSGSSDIDGHSSNSLNTGRHNLKYQKKYRFLFLAVIKMVVL